MSNFKKDLSGFQTLVSDNAQMDKHEFIEPLKLKCWVQQQHQQ